MRLRKQESAHVVDSKMVLVALGGSGQLSILSEQNAGIIVENIQPTLLGEKLSGRGFDLSQVGEIQILDTPVPLRCQIGSPNLLNSFQRLVFGPGGNIYFSVFRMQYRS